MLFRYMKLLKLFLIFFITFMLMDNEHELPLIGKISD
jgi:hypothetical protein